MFTCDTWKDCPTLNGKRDVSFAPINGRYVRFTSGKSEQTAAYAGNVYFGAIQVYEHLTNCVVRRSLLNGVIKYYCFGCMGVQILESFEHDWMHIPGMSTLVIRP